MPFQVDDRVVHPTHGVGRVVGLVTQRFSEAEARLYYEIAIQRSTVWIPVDADTARELRPLTPKAELARYRNVLRSRPASLTADHRQRRLDLLSRLKAGSFQSLCEVVRDLTARGWQKALGEMDATALRKTRDGLCQEWAAADGVSVLDAVKEVDALLLEGRQAYQA
jgi:RNA polymerase-interacting CarD/CdnL/TRCF family regulator